MSVIYNLPCPSHSANLKTGCSGFNKKCKNCICAYCVPCHVINLFASAGDQQDQYLQQYPASDTVWEALPSAADPLLPGAAAANLPNIEEPQNTDALDSGWDVYLEDESRAQHASRQVPSCSSPLSDTVQNTAQNSSHGVLLHWLMSAC